MIWWQVFPLYPMDFYSVGYSEMYRANSHSIRHNWIIIHPVHFTISNIEIQVGIFWKPNRIKIHGIQWKYLSSNHSISPVYLADILLSPCCVGCCLCVISSIGCLHRTVIVTVSPSRWAHATHFFKDTWSIYPKKLLNILGSINDKNYDQSTVRLNGSSIHQMGGYNTIHHWINLALHHALPQPCHHFRCCTLAHTFPFITAHSSVFRVMAQHARSCKMTR